MANSRDLPDAALLALTFEALLDAQAMALALLNQLAADRGVDVGDALAVRALIEAVSTPPPPLDLVAESVGDALLAALAGGALERDDGRAAALAKLALAAAADREAQRNDVLDAAAKIAAAAWNRS